jgi:AhpD family alkylhydroperoxidase
MSEPGHFHDVLSDLREPVKSLRALIPDTFSAFAKLSTSAMSEGALPTKTKELIALAIAITRECDGCIAAHAKGAARAGATPQEVADMIGVCILMNGGPGTVFGPRAWAAYQEFANESGTTTT